MKNETRNKIIESRKKYFQEIRNHKTESKTTKSIGRVDGFRRPPGPVSKPFDLSRGMRKIMPLPEVNLQQVLKQIKVSITPSKVINAERVHRLFSQAARPVNYAGRRVSETHSRWSGAVNLQAEKAIDRFSSYMMVIFDA